MHSCSCSIFGAILFIRLGWAVGQAGFWGTLSIFAVAGVTVTLTALSVSAISTNGAMKGGGAYFMISRSLGPEFGGSVGLVFYLANAVAVTFYMTAFAENVCDTYECYPSGDMGQVAPNTVRTVILVPRTPHSHRPRLFLVVPAFNLIGRFGCAAGSCTARLCSVQQAERVHLCNHGVRDHFYGAIPYS